MAVFLFIAAGFAQEAEGCKDHPLFSRMPEYVISECTQNYNQLDFYNNSGENVLLEGNLTYAWYIFNVESGKPDYPQLAADRKSLLPITKLKKAEPKTAGLRLLNHLRSNLRSR